MADHIRTPVDDIPIEVRRANWGGEKWLPVDGYEGLYEVSDLGRVRSLPRSTRTGRRGGQVLRLRLDAYGYLIVNLSREGTKETVKVHQLVMRSFVGPCPEGMEVLHGLPNSRDCAELSNLRYGTRSENLRQAAQEGTLYRRPRRDNCPRCGTRYIEKPSGGQWCPKCSKAQWARYYEREGGRLNAEKRANRAA